MNLKRNHRLPITLPSVVLGGTDGFARPLCRPSFFIPHVIHDAEVSERKASAIACGTSRPLRPPWHAFPAFWRAFPARLPRLRHGDLGLRLSNPLVGVGLLGLQFGSAEMLSPMSTSAISIERISKGRSAIESFVQDEFGNSSRIFEHVLVGVGRTDGGHDPLPDSARYDRFLGSSDEAIEVRTYRDARFSFAPMPSFATPSNRCRLGASETFRIDAGAHGFEDSFRCLWSRGRSRRRG